MPVPWILWVMSLRNIILKLAFFKGKGWVPLGDVPNIYIYMAYIGQHEGISRKQLGGYFPKGTHNFPLNFC